MLDELDSMKSNDAWELVDAPQGKRVLGCKWVFQLKRTADDKIARFKARLVAQGYNQQYGSEYDEVFAPVVRQTTFRTLMSVAAKRRMVVRQYDIKTAFLNGNLEEELFMRQPPGFVVKGAEGKVCRLKRSLYGLKQSARSWNLKLHQVLEEDGFKRSSADPCLYSKVVKGKRCYVLVYVDDLIIASEDERIIESVSQTLARNFEVVCLGELRNYVGIEVERDSAGDFHISQRRYIADIVKSAGLQDAKSSAIPIDVGYFKPDTEDKPLSDNSEYQKLVGKQLTLDTSNRILKTNLSRITRSIRS
ncbi:hypothetical protein RP20_CCG010184 [Aedes albopictus]|nr:hypothetical protein RP20_CCG010184 [Aedes albopictus]